MENKAKHIWSTILILILIFVLPIILNFVVFTPKCELCAGKLQDWISFWGSYLGAIISALAAFTILYIQRKDNKSQNEQNRIDNQKQHEKNRQDAYRENFKNRQLQLNILSYQQEIEWLSELRKALTNYISSYRENDIKDIINSTSNSSFESVYQKIKGLIDTLSRRDTALAIVICENPKTKIGDTYNKEIDKYYKRYTSIIDDIKLLLCLYFNKTPVLEDDINKLNNLIKTMKIDPKSFNYNQFSELASQLIEPLPNIFETIRDICKRCIIEERQRIESILNDNEID
jgi:hypothetical protein